MAIGQNDFKEEQRNLLYGKDNTNTKQFLKFQHALDPFNPEYAMQAFDGESSAWTKNNLKRLSSLDMPHDGISAIDILVCTPGECFFFFSVTSFLSIGLNCSSFIDYLERSFDGPFG